MSELARVTFHWLALSALQAWMAQCATIIRWKERFVAQGTDGPDTFHPGPRPTVLTPALRAKILAATRKKPADG